MLVDHLFKILVGFLVLQSSDHFFDLIVSFTYQFLMSIFVNFMLFISDKLRIAVSNGLVVIYPYLIYSLLMCVHEFFLCLFSINIFLIFAQYQLFLFVICKFFFSQQCDHQLHIFVRNLDVLDGSDSEIAIKYKCFFSSVLSIRLELFVKSVVNHYLQFFQVVGRAFLSCVMQFT